MATTVPRSKNETLKRIFSAVVLVSFSYYMFYKGPVLIMLTTLAVQVKCFNEIINVAYKRDPATTSVHSIAYYMLSIANYYFYCENLADQFKLFINEWYFVYLLVEYHKFVAFCLYFCGLIWFLSKTKRGHRRKQFKFLAFIHVLLVAIVLQTYMVVDNVFNGIIWHLMTVLLVTLNDILAFVVGKFFGRTPLIELSPKKTWEGYIGGALGTVLLGMILAHIFCTIDYLVCPIEYLETSQGITMGTNCTRSYPFTLQSYSLLNLSISTYPFEFHTFVIAIVASIVGPFGGFFASGFKRAYNVKNFGDTIPGHGGIMDRFDCFYLMLTFVNVYRNTFAQTQTVDKIFDKFLKMDNEKQLQFFYLLEKSLESTFMLGSNTTIIG